MSLSTSYLTSQQYLKQLMMFPPRNIFQPGFQSTLYFRFSTYLIGHSFLIFYQLLFFCLISQYYRIPGFCPCPSFILYTVSFQKISTTLTALNIIYLQLTPELCLQPQPLCLNSGLVMTKYFPDISTLNDWWISLSSRTLDS